MNKPFFVSIPPGLGITLRHLAPISKARVRAALEQLGANPALGKALKAPLLDFYSYRVNRLRIIYQIDTRLRILKIIDVDERKIIYDKIIKYLNL